MVVKYIIIAGLLIILNGCAGLRQQTGDIFLYQQKIVLAIVYILTDGNVDKKTETTLYDYEDRIGKSCQALQEAGYKKMYGQELSMDLKTKIINGLEDCENSVREAELYLIARGFSY